MAVSVVLVCLIGIGLVGKQQSNALEITVLSALHQCSPAAMVSGVHIRAIGQQGLGYGLAVTVVRWADATLKP